MTLHDTIEWQRYTVDTHTFNEGQPTSACTWGMLHQACDGEDKQVSKCAEGKGFSLCSPGPYNSNIVQIKQ